MHFVATAFYHWMAIPIKSGVVQTDSAGTSKGTVFWNGVTQCRGRYSAYCGTLARGDYFPEQSLPRPTLSGGGIGGLVRTKPQTACT